MPFATWGFANMRGFCKKKKKFALLTQNKRKNLQNRGISSLFIRKLNFRYFFMKNTLKERKSNFCEFRGFFANGACSLRNGPIHKLTSLNKLKLVSPQNETVFFCSWPCICEKFNESSAPLKRAQNYLSNGYYMTQWYTI